jgi:hypothetical protein
MPTRRPSVSALTKPTQRLPRKTTQRLPPADVEPEAVDGARPDRATARLLQVLAEEIDELRTELQALRDEVSVLRAVGPGRKLSGSYRGVTKSE